jgi:Signal transduction histidine kinase
MKDLSLHILDIVQNSTRANATVVEILVEEDAKKNLISITIKDNGKGMSPDMVKQVEDPFVTSRTTRKVGLGIPLFKQSAVQSGGDLHIFSEVGIGTTLVATFQMDNIDTPPWGDLPGVVAMLSSGNPDVDFVYDHYYNGNHYTFDTREVKEILGDTPIFEPGIARFIKEMIAENVGEIKK